MAVEEVCPFDFSALPDTGGVNAPFGGAPPFFGAFIE